MIRMTVVACALTAVGCSRATEPATPTGPSTVGTVYYPSGDSAKVTGSSGWWTYGSSNGTPLVLIIANMDPMTGADSLRPALQGIDLTFGGSHFTSFPQAVTLSLGANPQGNMGAQMGIASTSYNTTSGTASVTALGGQYARVDLVLTCAAMTFRGTLIVPNGCPTCVPSN